MRLVVGLFDESRHAGTVTIEGGEMPDVIVRGNEAFLYCQDDQLLSGQRLELKKEEGARFLKVKHVVFVQDLQHTSC